MCYTIFYNCPRDTPYYILR